MWGIEIVETVAINLLTSIHLPYVDKIILPYTNLEEPGLRGHQGGEPPGVSVSAGVEEATTLHLPPRLPCLTLSDCAVEKRFPLSQRPFSKTIKTISRVPKTIFPVDKMMSRQTMGAALVALLCTSLVTSTLAASMDAQEAQTGRKFVTKSNNIKKNEDLRRDTQPQPRPQQAVPSPAKQTGEFSWSKLVSLGVQLVLNVLGGGDNAAIDKMDSGSPVEGILTAIISYLTGSNNPDEVGVMAKQASELFGLVVTLLDALRTSFSQRSFDARSIGTSDPFADAGVAATTMLKSTPDPKDTYPHTHLSHTSPANNYLTRPHTCRYGMSYLLERTTYTPFEIFNDAGRRGRVGENCKTVFNECNQV
ncbi:hypothetical protein E2C01_022597 [Portunus trituberculatus]|uniref:Uncharacterized protein n=1 Tax=Portunus trituberculatus TaxID=210409 RepID=A0A5B7E7Q2_PORTR|nr:hypothetical protein [Portunus trituberculatus]